MLKIINKTLNKLHEACGFFGVVLNFYVVKKSILLLLKACKYSFVIRMNDTWFEWKTWDREREGDEKHFLGYNSKYDS